VRRNLDRDANPCAPAGTPPVFEAEGFTFVEIVIAALLAGIFTAIVVFSVFTVTHPAPKPDPACTEEVRHVRLAIAAYQARNNETNPSSLGALVKQKLLPAVPSATSPSGAAGYTYDPAQGTYDGGTCPSR
jgi:hypothetical protein